LRAGYSLFAGRAGAGVLVGSRADFRMISLSFVIVQTWLRSLNGRHLEGVVSLYADEAVLIPAFSSQVLRTSAQRRGYYERLLAQPGLEVSLHEKTFACQSLGDGFSVASGIYCFRMEADGESLGFEARFSCTLNSTLVAPIIHHHSSQILRTLP